MSCAFGWLAHSRNARLRLFTEDTPEFIIHVSALRKRKVERKGNSAYVVAESDQ